MNNKAIIFIIVPDNRSNSNLGNKLRHLCQTFDVKTVAVPKTDDLIDSTVENIYGQIGELTELSNETKNHINVTMETLAAKSNYSNMSLEKNDFSFIEEFRLLVSKEKAIYTTLNYFKHNSSL